MDSDSAESARELRGEGPARPSSPRAFRDRTPECAGKDGGPGLTMAVGMRLGIEIPIRCSIADAERADFEAVYYGAGGLYRR